MSKKNESVILFIALLVTLGFLQVVGSWFGRQFQREPRVTESPTTESATTSPNVDQSPPSSQTQSTTIEPRLSVGALSFVSTVTSEQKRLGIQAIAQGQNDDTIAPQKYAEAVEHFTATLAENRNDPESLIYLNNARIGQRPAYAIAIAAPLSEEALDVGQELLRGVAQAQDEINQAGGIHGVPLRVMIANDQNDPQIAKQVAKSLVQQTEVLGVIGHFSSGVSLAASQIYQNNQVAMISPTSTSVDLSPVGDYIFRTVQNDRLAASGLARHMLDTWQAETAAVFYNSDSGYSKSLKDAFTSAVITDGGQVVAEFDLARADFDAQADVKQAQQRGATVLMLAANTPTRSQALEVIAANQQQFQLLGGDSLYNAEVLQAGQADAVGLIVAAPWHRDNDPTNAFPDAAAQLWGGDVSWRTAMTYDAAQTLIAALDQNPTRQGVQKVLAATEFRVEGASGSIQFMASGDRNLAPQLVVVEPGKKAGYGYDFVPLQSP